MGAAGRAPARGLWVSLAAEKGGCAGTEQTLLLSLNGDRELIRALAWLQIQVSIPYNFHIKP